LRTQANADNQVLITFAVKGNEKSNQVENKNARQKYEETNFFKIQLQ